MRVKMSKQTPLALTARAVDHCPFILDRLRPLFRNDCEAVLGVGRGMRLTINTCLVGMEDEFSSKLNMGSPEIPSLFQHK